MEFIIITAGLYLAQEIIREIRNVKQIRGTYADTNVPDNNARPHKNNVVDHSDSIDRVDVPQDVKQ